MISTNAGETSVLLAGMGGEHYPITIGTNLDAEIGEALKKEAQSRRVAVISDSGVLSALRKELSAVLNAARVEYEIFEFAAGESQKNQETATRISHELLTKKYGRDTLIVAFGGGVVGDLAGFIAATYLRGVPYINIPTTLLAMVDSSVGGKVGIDTPYGKNTVGAFYPARAVLMDMRFIAKLPPKEIINGLLEALKTFLTSDAESIALVERVNRQNPASDLALLSGIVRASVAIKAGITERDPKEENERKIINFGHTIGHAIEFLSNYSLAHGYSVGYGMLVEANIAASLGILSEEDHESVVRSLAHVGIVPSDFPIFSPDAIIEATKGDKKVRAGQPYYVLLNGIGSVYTKDRAFAHPVDDEVVRRALASL